MIKRILLLWALIVFTICATAQGKLQLSLAPLTLLDTNYTASYNEFIPVNASSGDVAITLPNAPYDRTWVGVKLVATQMGHVVNINTAGTDTFNIAGGATTLTAFMLNQGYLFQYHAATKLWYVIATSFDLNSLDNRYAPYLGSSSIVSLGNIASGSWSADKIGLEYGGTNSDLSSTGGAHQFLKQTTLGGSVTVDTISLSDLPINIPNSNLQFSSVNINGNPVSLGGSITLHPMSFQTLSSNVNPAASTNTYWGGSIIRSGGTNVNAVGRIEFPVNCTVKAVYINMDNGTDGSTETSSIYLRINNTTDNLIINNVVNTGSQYYSNTSMNVPVNAGDYFEIKWVTPAWVTPPVNVRMHCVVYVE